MNNNYKASKMNKSPKRITETQRLLLLIVAGVVFGLFFISQSLTGLAVNQIRYTNDSLNVIGYVLISLSIAVLLYLILTKKRK